LEGGKAVFTSFDKEGDMLAFHADTKKHPDELFTFSLDDNSLTKLTDYNAWLKDYKLGKQEKITYEARDGLKIEGVLIYPVGYEEGKRYPLINMIHGGPEAAILNGWQTYYSRWGQVAAGKGYFVFMPNYRASSGRGTEFTMKGFKDLVGKEFTDVIDGVDYLIDQGMVDKDRVGIGGGSYGGYFSNWAATKHSERFAAAVSFVGVSDQISKRFETDIPVEDYLVHWGIWTHEDPMLVYDRSPVKYAKNNETPILILHGTADPRVHPSQSLEMYRAIKLHGNAPVRLIWYPGEGHGNRRNSSKLDYSLRTMRWFDYYLKSDKPKDQKPESELEYDKKFLGIE
jgi:dipeptidyl aminopeptidase/acylaminoacyl peptidase